MEVSSNVMLTIPATHKKVLWGILHHHLKVMDLDDTEKGFVTQSLAVLDADKEYERWYATKTVNR